MDDAPISTAKIRAARTWRLASPVLRVISIGSWVFNRKPYKITVRARRGIQQMILHMKRR
jgi:hypothetical protein